MSVLPPVLPSSATPVPALPQLITTSSVQMGSAVAAQPVASVVVQQPTAAGIRVGSMVTAPRTAPITQQTLPLAAVSMTSLSPTAVVVGPSNRRFRYTFWAACLFVDPLWAWNLRMESCMNAKLCGNNCGTSSWRYVRGFRVTVSECYTAQLEAEVEACMYGTT